MSDAREIPIHAPAARSELEVAGPASDHATGSIFGLRRFLALLLRFWWLPVLTLGIGLAGTTLYILNRPPTFVSHARMWETVKLRLPNEILFSEDVQNFLGTQSELLKSVTLRRLALEHLRASGTAVPLDENGRPLRAIIRVSPASRSSVFLLEASSSDPDYTQAYLNSLMAVYLNYKRDVRKLVSGDTLASITEQLQRSEFELKAWQDSLAVFQKTNNLAVLEEESRITGGYLARLRTQLSDLQLAERILNSVTTEVADGTNDTVSGGLEWMDVAGPAPGSPSNGAEIESRGAFRDLELLKLQRARLSRYLKPKHPKILKLDADIDRGEKLMDIFRAQGREQLAASRQEIRVKSENILALIREWETKVIEANSQIAEAERIRANIQRSQGVYERLLMLFQSVGISRNIDQETLSILEPASSAVRSYSAECGYFGLAVLGGFGLGIGIVFLLMVHDDRFSTMAEINERLPELVVGQVPEVRELPGESSVPLLKAGDPRHAYVESFRSLRSALLFMAVERARPKVVLITSASPHEGKSTITVNLARALAFGGARVVVVDGDVRKGSLHRLLGHDRTPGLTEVLRDPGQLEAALQTNSLPNLAFIPSGNVSANGDLFLAPAFDRILATLRERFDYVLIDSSPLFAADDAATLAPKVDGTLMVVRSRFSRASTVREALDLLYQRNARVLGLIFNQVDASARSYNYYKYAEYHPSDDTHGAPAET